MPTSKVYQDAAEALFDLTEGITLTSGGFGLCGIAENCIDQIERMGNSEFAGDFAQHRQPG